MNRRTARPVVAALLSLVVPGGGHLYAGARRRGLILFGIWAALCLGAAAALFLQPVELVAETIGWPLLASVLLVNVLVFAFRVFAIVDAGRQARGSAVALFSVAGIVVAAALPHVAVGYMAVRSYDVLTSVFADEEPQSALPARGLFVRPPVRETRPANFQRRKAPRARNAPAQAAVPSKPLEASRRIVLGSADWSQQPWVTILLLGSDRGPGQWGERTDTMIVAGLQRKTGRAVVFGVPRNLVQVPLVDIAGSGLPPFKEPLNALYSFARTRPELFPGGSDPGATALKQAISRLLGLRVDYYALVDLDGFRDMVDALGGVEILVKERLVDEVTRPAPGETKPRIDVYPGRTYRFSGRTALAYVRSRKASNDYRRMARQRCFLSALASQLDVLAVLRNFVTLASTVKSSVRTDIPLDRSLDLVRLAAGVDPKQTLTETFGVPYIARRRRSDRYPIPDMRKIQAAVRDVIVRPERADRRHIATTAASC